LSGAANKFLVVGLGSMGKRRVRDLIALKAGDVIGFDVRADRRQQTEGLHGVPTYGTFADAMAENPTAIVISTPPEHHVEYAQSAARSGRHFFIEASVVQDGLDELISLCRGQSIVAAPSATMRFHPLARRVKEQIDSGEIGRPLSFTYHFGQYLPDWHPWEDYRDFYASRRQTSGSREMVSFVSVWLTWLFGDVQAVSAFKASPGTLDVDIDEVYHVGLRFRSGVLGSLVSDVVSHVPYRTFRLVGDRGVIEWDWNAGQLRTFTQSDGKWRITPEGYGFRGFSSEQTYLFEMEHFVKAVRGETTWDYSLQDDARVLAILYAADRSSDGGQHVMLADATENR
jgi:predicted dehydrogenase